MIDRRLIPARAPDGTENGAFEGGEFGVHGHAPGTLPNRQALTGLARALPWHSLRSGTVGGHKLFHADSFEECSNETVICKSRISQLIFDGTPGRVHHRHIDLPALGGVWSFVQLFRHLAARHQYRDNGLTFLAVFLIQNSQNRDGAAIQAKLDEVLIAVSKARSELVGIENLTDADLLSLKSALEREALKPNVMGTGDRPTVDEILEHRDQE
jgi:hypothetical protein